MAINQYLDSSGVLQRELRLSAGNEMVILDSAEEEVMDIENHGADGDHSFAGDDALPAQGIRASQLKHATGSSTGTAAQQTIAHGLAVAPTIVLFTLKTILAAVTEVPFMSSASDATNIYVTVGTGIDYNWVAIV